MNKKLTALEALHKIANIEMKEQYKADKGGFVYRVVSDECPKELKVIETALKEKEETDNAIAYGGGIYAANGIIGKQLKAFEIIKKYNLRPSSITISTDYEDFMEYNFLAEGETIKEFFDKNEYLAPTKEEYDLLKEVLK